MTVKRQDRAGQDSRIIQKCTASAAKLRGTRGDSLPLRSMEESERGLSRRPLSEDVCSFLEGNDRERRDACLCDVSRTAPI